MILNRMPSQLKIELEGLPPAKKNSRRNFKSGVSLPSVRYEVWNKYAVAEISEQWSEEPLKQTSSMCVTFSISDKRRKDLDNIKVVSPIQLYLDLNNYKGRGEEAAQFLYEQEIKPQWSQNQTIVNEK